MFSKHTGGEVVKGGVYWSSASSEFITVPKEGGILPGPSADRFTKFPLLAVLIVGPIMGLVFAFFLPLSGVLVVGSCLVNKFRGAAAPSAAAMASPRMAPGVSYLEKSSGAPAETAAEGEEKGKLVDLAEEIAEKRWKDK